MVDKPKRIISLVPSITELLFDLELEDRIAGITKFCVRPHQQFKRTTKVGGTKKINFEVIERLQPDLVLANKEENTKAEIERLERHFPVWISDIETVDEAIAMVRNVGQLTNSEDRANGLANQILKNFKTINEIDLPVKVVYLIWNKPLMAAGKNTFINTMLEKAGFINAVDQPRYPEVDLNSLDTSNVLLSSEPFPFQEKHIKGLKKEYPNKDFYLVDGEMFSWYGSRMQYFPAYVRSISTAIRSSQK